MVGHNGPKGIGYRLRFDNKELEQGRTVLNALTELF